MRVFERVVVPVASEPDAVGTVEALSPHLDGIAHLTVVHVIEKGGGVIDKAPMEQRRADAAAFLSMVESRLDGEVTVETRIEFGTNVAETVLETARDVDATAIAFRPRGGSRLVRWLTGDTRTGLVGNADLPVVSLPAVTDTDSSPSVCPRAMGTETETETETGTGTEING